MVNYVSSEAASVGPMPWFSPVEGLDAPALRSLQDARLRQQFDYLWARSTFYQRKFRAAGLRPDSVRTVDDLQKVPFTGKQELRDSLKAAPPFGEHLAAPMCDVIQMQASSGTTGSPSYVALTRRDAVMWQESSARSLFACGIRPGDLVLHGFSMSKGFVGGLPDLPGAAVHGRGGHPDRRRRRRRAPAGRGLRPAPPGHRRHAELPAAPGRRGAGAAGARRARDRGAPVGGRWRARRRHPRAAPAHRAGLGRQALRADGRHRPGRHLLGRVRRTGRHAHDRARPHRRRTHRPGVRRGQAVHRGRDRRAGLHRHPAPGLAGVPLPQRRPRRGHRHRTAPAAGGNRRSAASAAPTTC